LGFGEGDHGKHPPIYRAGRSLCAGTANMAKKKKKDLL
jgi:hypothetical protein